jgi:predicted porin
MNNKIKLAVAGAVLSAASVANAGIIIPAGDWTIDINGNVNAFANFTNYDSASTETITGAIAGTEDATGEDSVQGINTGLLPAWLGFTGTTRQNDVDVSFTISFQPNVSDNGAMGDVLTPLNRQAFVTFGDKSWGTVKLGKDLGIFAGNAILNDMTLLGVGAGAGKSGAQTTLGGIGTGYIYPSWKGQIAYTTPNMNGFTATIAITNPDQGNAFGTTGGGTTTSNAAYQDRLGYEGQVQYAWSGDMAGKVWSSFASYEKTANESTTVFSTDGDENVNAWDIGGTVSVGNLGLTAYYFDSEGMGSRLLGEQAFYSDAGKMRARDVDGGYVQATYVIPTGTKLGLAYGVNNTDKASNESDSELVKKSDRWTIGAYHPLTKHLNLVAEYNKIESEAHDATKDAEQDTFSIGAILFF